MATQGIWEFRELSKATGIKYDTLLDRMDHPANFRAFELRAICETLNISADNLYELINN